MYDIVVVGAGPAGAAICRLLDKRYKILLIDKRDLTNIEDDGKDEKSCGGLLAPDAQKMLAKIGLGVPKKILVGPQLFTVKSIDLNHNIERYYQRHYINVNRKKFDQWLVSLVPSNVDTYFNCCYNSFQKEDNRIKVKLKKGNRYTYVYTKILVGADGAASSIRKQLFNHDACPKIYVSIQEWYETKYSMPFFTSIFDNAVTDFYSWTIPKDNQIILGAAIPKDEHPLKKFELLKSKLIEYGFDFKNCKKRKGALIFRPMRLNQICTGNNTLALIGEAGGFISPSSAEGISYAIKSAIALSDSINEKYTDFTSLYNKKVKPIKRNILIKNLKVPFMYQKNLRNIIMRSGVLSMTMHPNI